MKIVLFGGNSPENKSWLSFVKKILSKDFNDVLVHEYLHWSSEESLINLDKELERLKIILKNYQNYIIVAKSAGTLLALKGIYEGSITPLACVFIGTAVLWGRERNFKVDDWLNNYLVPTLFVHKLGDPAINSDELIALLKKHSTKNYEFLFLPGTEHSYSNYQDIAKDVHLWIEKYQ